MVLTGNGSVGIGTTDPHAEMEISSSAGSLYGNTMPIIRNTGDLGAGWHFIPGGGAKEWYVHATGTGNYQGTNKFVFKTEDSTDVMTLTTEGKVGIGTSSIPSDYKLAVDGKIICENVKVLLKQNWPDFVLEKDYSLMTLSELENYIDTCKHLPGVPSAKEVKQNGIMLGDMNAVFLQKIEELSLYIIQLNKRISELESKVNTEK